MRRASSIAGLVLIVTAFTARAHAHEASGNHVVVTLPAGDAYAAELTVDGESLVARLEMAAGQKRSGAQTASECLRRVTQLGEELSRHVHLRFDGSPDAPVFDGAIETSTPEHSRHFHGRGPVFWPK